MVAISFELGLFQQAFDTRSIVEDGTVGADFWIIRVDGNPTDRIQHGLLITKVPFAIVEPGERIMELSETPRSTEDQALVEFRARIQKGTRYRIMKNKDGHPELVAK